MKKMNILAVVAVAVLASASVARAEVNIEFDGRLKPQSMHDVFANSHQLIQLPELVSAKKASEFSRESRGNYPWLDEGAPINWNSILQYIQTEEIENCLPVIDGPMWIGCVVGDSPATLTAVSEVPGRSFRELSAPQKKALAVSYLLQADLKNALISRSALYKFSPETIRFISDPKTRVLHDNRKVYVTNGSALIAVADSELAAVAKALRSAALRRIGEERELATFIGGAGVIIGCMANDNCWGTIGDTVSDISEAITHQYYTNGPGAGQQQGWDDMPD